MHAWFDSQLDQKILDGIQYLIIKRLLSTLTIIAEQIGFYKTNEKLGNSGFTTIFLGQNYSVDLSQIQRGSWKNTGGFGEYEGPDLEDYYTYFSLKEYFYIFWVILILQTVVIYVVKYCSSEQFNKLTWFDKILAIAMKYQNQRP